MGTSRRCDGEDRKAHLRLARRELCRRTRQSLAAGRLRDRAPFGHVLRDLLITDLPERAGYR
jgi:hypothetical protein